MIPKDADLTKDPRLPGKSKRRAIIALAAVAMVAYVGAGFAVDAARVREAIERRIAHRFPAWAGKTP